MDAHWFQKLVDVLRIQTNSENEKLMVLYLDKELRKLKLKYGIDAAGNVIVTKGKAKTYPCVVSHMDTVHDFVPNFEVYQEKGKLDNLFALNGEERVGIGGDDKCGVFACLYLLKVIPEIKVVFFSREEKGCRGSTSIDKRFFADCRYLIQLDRRGSKDFIQTYWGSKTVSHIFSSEIGLVKKKYKYKNCIGTVTDVMKLWDSKVGVSCINLSCGYYNPHTNQEYVSVNDLWHSVKFTEEIINTMQPKRYVSLPPVSTITKVSYVTGTWKPSDYKPCYKCGKYKKQALLYEVKDKRDKPTGKLVCYLCKEKGEPILSIGHKKHNTDSGSYCEECKERKITTLYCVGDKVVCYSCKEEHDNAALEDIKKIKQNGIEQSVLPDGEIILFACHECGKNTDELEKGSSLKYAGNDNKLYCNNCASILFSASDTEKPPEKCYICYRVIPKDHQVIERFGVQICEYCATQEELS